MGQPQPGLSNTVGAAANLGPGSARPQAMAGGFHWGTKGYDDAVNAGRPQPEVQPSVVQPLPSPGMGPRRDFGPPTRKPYAPFGGSGGKGGQPRPPMMGQPGPVTGPDMSRPSPQPIQPQPQPGVTPLPSPGGPGPVSGGGKGGQPQPYGHMPERARPRPANPFTQQHQGNWANRGGF